MRRLILVEMIGARWKRRENDRLFHVDLSGTSVEDEGMACGGVVDVLPELI